MLAWVPLYEFCSSLLVLRVASEFAKLHPFLWVKVRDATWRRVARVKEHPSHTHAAGGGGEGQRSTAGKSWEKRERDTELARQSGGRGPFGQVSGSLVSASPPKTDSAVVFFPPAALRVSERVASTPASVAPLRDKEDGGSRGGRQLLASQDFHATFDEHGRLRGSQRFPQRWPPTSVTLFGLVLFVQVLWIPNPPPSLSLDSKSCWHFIFALGGRKLRLKIIWKFSW